MKRIRDAQTILGTLEDGKAIQALSKELVETLAYLKEHSADRPKARVKGIELAGYACFLIFFLTLFAALWGVQDSDIIQLLNR